MKQVGKRCGDDMMGARNDGDEKKKKALKEDHIFGEFENIVHVVCRRLEEVRVWGWGT